MKALLRCLFLLAMPLVVFSTRGAAATIECDGVKTCPGAPVTGGQFDLTIIESEKTPFPDKRKKVTEGEVVLVETPGTMPCDGTKGHCVLSDEVEFDNGKKGMPGLALMESDGEGLELKDVPKACGGTFEGKLLCVSITETVMEDRKGDGATYKACTSAGGLCNTYTIISDVGSDIPEPSSLLLTSLVLMSLGGFAILSHAQRATPS
jgi:hypothetical protein